MIVLEWAVVAICVLLALFTIAALFAWVFISTIDWMQDHYEAWESEDDEL